MTYDELLESAMSECRIFVNYGAEAGYLEDAAYALWVSQVGWPDSEGKFLKFEGLDIDDIELLCQGIWATAMETVREAQPELSTDLNIPTLGLSQSEHNPTISKAR